jgi:thioredoxin 1
MISPRHATFANESAAESGRIRRHHPLTRTHEKAMPALNLDTDAEQIAERISRADTLFVACLCAEWCGACREYRAGFDLLADAHPDICFAWIDIENQADRFDDLDVENFPTILIEDSVTTRFFGTVLPQPAIVARMLTDLTALPGVIGAPKLRPALVVA